MKSINSDFFKDIVENEDDLFTRIDNKGRLQYLSPSAEKIIGISPNLCLGKKALSFVHKEDRRSTLECFVGLIANRVKKAELENRIVRTTGEAVTFIWFVHLYYDNNGNLLEILTVGKVITQMKEVVNQLQKREEMWNKLFTTSPTWIALVTLKEGTFLDFNNTFCNDTGYDKEEVIGRTSLDIGLWSDAEGRARALSLIKERGGYLEKLPIRLRMKNGELRNFLWSSAIIEMQGKRCLINILVDISNLKKIENQLAETNRALQEQSSKLFEMNSALKVLLNQREEERKELETRVWHNIKRMIQPHLNNLRMTNLTTTQQAHLDVVFDRLDDIASGIGERLGYGVYSLSGREMEVAGHIIAGRSNKDIAETLNISVHSIESHRFAIRKKLGILGNRTNLRNHLLSLSKYAEDKNSFLTKEF